MSFLFNFDSPEDSETGEHESTRSEDKTAKNDAKDVQSSPAWEVTEFYEESVTSKLEMKPMQFGEHCLRVVDTSCVEQKLLDDKELSSVLGSSGQLHGAITSHSDLVAGVYEGGLKIWECGVDLAEFLSSHPVGKAVDIQGKTVLELGCGAGLPGLYCCKCGAQKVDFQDFNEEVLKLLTHTNVMKSLSEEAGKSLCCRYFAGDWSSFSRLASEEGLKYDIILTAETIYNTENYSKLHEVFRTTLAEDGVVFLAAKTYYFGVGGSVEAFIEFVGSEGCFSVDTVLTISKGVARKILQLRRLHKSEKQTENETQPE